MTVFSKRTPNRSARVGAPRFFVMHSTEGTFDSAVAWFQNPAAQASADEVVSIDGSRVCVFNTAASRLKTWAVGNGNSVSMSWENEGHAGHTVWPRAHYRTLADRLYRAQKAVKKVYGVTIPLKRTHSSSIAGITGHLEMARWFGGSDHTDPGTTFDYELLEAECARRARPIIRFQYVIRGGGGKVLKVLPNAKAMRALRWGKLARKHPKFTVTARKG